MTADPAQASALALADLGPGSAVARLRRSPLAHRRSDLESSSSDQLTLAELPFLTMVNLRVAPGSAAASRVEAALAVALPGPGQVATVASLARSILWLGPTEWLVIGPDGDAGPLLSLLHSAIEASSGSVVDVSANRAALVATGPRARDLLEKACTIDLHPRAFTVGQCAQTTFARSHVLIWQTSPAPQRSPSAVTTDAAPEPVGPAYRLLFRPSFADYFVDWLTDAAIEFTA